MKSRCFLSLSLAVAAAAKGHLSCKSYQGKDVDFAYSFKYPDGFAYAYMDAKTKLSLAAKALNTDDSSITLTVKQMNNPGVSYVIWNDEPVGAANSAAPNAHSKGLLILDKTGGIWLTHSLPEFPKVSKTTKGMWKEGSPRYGQSYLCININADQVHKLVPLFNFTRPTIYATKWDKKSEAEYDDLVDLSERGHWDKKTMTDSVVIKSKGGQKFTFYAKNGKWGKNKDLYSDLVAPKEGPLILESWRHGAGVWGPACGKNEVLDASEVKFPGKTWVTTKDHSKWAVTQDRKVLCVGDLNRAKGQDMRGGATVCIHHPKIAAQMDAVISETDDCKKSLLLSEEAPASNVTGVVIV